MGISNLIDLGTDQQNMSSANKIRLTNIISLVTVLISAGYTLNYFFILHQPFVALINMGFTLAYGLTFTFVYFNAYKNAKLWFFLVLMLHLYVCTNIYATNASGFHLYYFLVPTGAFLLFELDEKLEKFTLSIISIFLMVYCENTFNSTPLIELSDAVNSLLYQSVIITNMVEVIIVITVFNNQIQLKEKKLIKQATTDSLTNVANRHCFFEQGTILLNTANHQNSPFTLILIDFDNFKKINDSYGHASGDLCLIEISNVIKNNCRNHDLFARIGGEEFIIVLPDTTAIEALNIAEQLRIAIENKIISIEDNNPITCTASFGVVTKTENKAELKTLLKQADQALYFAKEQGRNRVHQYQ